MPNLSVSINFRFQRVPCALPNYKTGEQRPKPGLILVAGKEQAMPEEGGFYYLNWREEETVKRKSTETRDLDVPMKLQGEKENALKSWCGVELRQ